MPFALGLKAVTRIPSTWKTHATQQPSHSRYEILEGRVCFLFVKYQCQAQCLEPVKLLETFVVCMIEENQKFSALLIRGVQDIGQLLKLLDTMMSYIYLESRRPLDKYQATLTCQERKKTCDSLTDEALSVILTGMPLWEST